MVNANASNSMEDANSNAGSSDAINNYGEHAELDNHNESGDGDNRDVLDQSQYVPMYPGHRLKRVWRNVGWYSSESEMNAVRKLEKVSKRKSIKQANGTKVFYRCNNWRRTNCNYRMFAMFYEDNKISLNASGDHDHVVKAVNNVNINDSSNINDNKLTANTSYYCDTGRHNIQGSSQDQILSKFIRDATAQSSYLLDDNDDTMRVNVSNVGSLNPSGDNECYEYSICNVSNISELANLCIELNYTFRYNSRRTNQINFISEYNHRTFLFTDLGTTVSVAEEYDGIVQSFELWRKGDWKQFLWAIRGKCLCA